MARKAIVRVVVGAGDADGLRALRAALREDDFRIVGEASSVETLQLIVHDTEPDVVVLDAAIPAASVLASRDAAPGAGIVVVWPEGITPVGADRHVTPSTIGGALAAAVRGAVRVRRASGPVTPPSPVVLAEEEPPAQVLEEPPMILEDAPVSLVPSAAAAASAADEPEIQVAGGGSTGGDGSPGGPAEPRVARLPAMVAAAAAFLILVAAAFGVLRGGGQPGTAADAPGTGPSVSAPSTPGSAGGTWPTAGTTSQLGGAFDGLLVPSPAGTGGATGHRPQSGPGDTNGAGPHDGPQLPTSPARTPEPGQSGEPHGRSGEHGHSGDPHGHSGDPHGHSGDPHGHSGEHGSGH
jgi:hypothetical protein